MRTWDELWNIVDYHIRERHLAPWGGALAHYWRETCIAMHGWISGRWLPWPRRRTKETTPMEIDALERAQAKTVIAELDQPFLDALRSELYDRWHDQLVAQAREELTPEYEAKFQRRCERWQDDHAGYKRTLQDEYDAQRERDREQDRRRLRRAFEERLETAQEAQAQAEQRVAQTDEQLLMLIKALLPEGQKPFLRECGIETLDVWGLNQQILHRHGLQIHYELTASTQRLVNIRTKEALWERATRFWLAPYEPPDELEVNGIPAKYIVRSA